MEDDTMTGLEEWNDELFLQYLKDMDNGIVSPFTTFNEWRRIHFITKKE